MKIENLKDRIVTIVCSNNMSDLDVAELADIGCIIELLHKTDYLTAIERHLMLQRVEDEIAEAAKHANNLINTYTFNWLAREKEAEGIMKRVKIPYGRWKLYGYNVIEIAIDGHSYYGLMMDNMGYIKGYMVIMDKYRDKAKKLVEQERANNEDTVCNDKGEAPDSK